MQLICRTRTCAHICFSKNEAFQRTVMANFYLSVRKYCNRKKLTRPILREQCRYDHLWVTRVQTYCQKPTCSKDKEYQEQQQQHSEHGHYSRIIERLVKIEEATRLYGYSTLKIGGMILVFVGTIMYFFREKIRESIAGEVSHVTSRSLSDEGVQNKAQDLALALLNEILTDDKIQDLSVVFLQNVFGQPRTSESASKLLEVVLTDTAVQAKLILLLKRILIGAFEDETFRDNLAQTLKPLLVHESVMFGVQQLFIGLFNNETVQKEAANFLREVIATGIVVDQATQLGKTVTNNIAADTGIQQEVGNALWTSAMNALTPSFFSSRGKET